MASLHKDELVVSHAHTLQLLTHPSHALSPLTMSSHQGTYLEIPCWIGVNNTSIACDPSQVIPNPGYLRFPVNVRTYDLDALIATAAEFSPFLKANPDFSGSTIMIEQWPLQAVRARAGEGGVVERAFSLDVNPSTSTTHITPVFKIPNARIRSNSTLTLLYSPNSTSSKLDEVAWAARTKMQRKLVRGAERDGGHYAYVNYASGGEGVGEISGEK